MKRKFKRKDGRLGIDSNLDSTSIASCIPKTIFGSLHQVSELNSRYWHSTIIAEQTLNTRPVRSVSYAEYMRKGSTSASSIVNSFEADQVARAASEINARIRADFVGFSEENDFRHNNNVSEENSRAVFGEPDNDDDKDDDSGVPEWLKNDLKDAEFIPIEALRDVQEPIKMSLDEALKELERLRLENESLKSQNAMVRSLDLFFLSKPFNIIN